MPAPSRDIPHMRGLNAFFNFQFDGVDLKIKTKDWGINQNVTDVVDDVGGEGCSRVDTVHNFWEYTANVFTRDLRIMVARLSDLTNDINNAAPLAKAVSMKGIARDLSKQAFVTGGTFAWGAFNIAMAARSDALMQALKFRSGLLLPTKSP